MISIGLVVFLGILAGRAWSVGVAFCVLLQKENIARNRTEVSRRFRPCVHIACWSKGTLCSESISASCEKILVGVGEQEDVRGVV